MVIPFTDNSAHVKDDFCTQRRLAITKEFVVPDDFRWPALDVGERSWAGEQLERYVSWKPGYPPAPIDFENTEPVDFNYRLGNRRFGYKVVLCLEVIEHVMNPLQLMEQIRDALGPKGVVYLSTPVRNRLGFMFNESCHFTEYSERSIETLVRYAGFDITKKLVFRTIPIIKGYIRGGGIFRTSLRVWSQKTQLYRLVKR